MQDPHDDERNDGMEDDDLQVWTQEDEDRLKGIAKEIYSIYCSGTVPSEEQKEAFRSGRLPLQVTQAMTVAGYVLLMVLGNLDRDTRIAATIEFGTSLLSNVALLEDEDEKPNDKGPH